MSTETWGQMPKSQNDPKLIEERVAEMIAEHEHDPEAHLGPGESIEVHRTQSIIDHPAYSIVGDKYSEGDPNNNFFRTDFKTLDNWSKGGQGGARSGMRFTQLYSGYSTGNYYFIWLDADPIPPYTHWFNPDTHELLVETVVEIRQHLTHLIRFGMNVEDTYFLGEDGDGPGIAFKIEGGKVWAQYAADQGAITNVELMASVPVGVHKYSVHYKNGAFIRWYIDDTLFYELTVGVPRVYEFTPWAYDVKRGTAVNSCTIDLYSLSMERRLIV